MNRPFSNHCSVSRRTAIKTLAGATIASPALLRVTNAQGLQRVKFTLPWLPEGSVCLCLRGKGGRTLAGPRV